MTLIITAICTYIQVAAFIGWQVAVGDQNKLHGWIVFARSWPPRVSSYVAGVARTHKSA